MTNTWTEFINRRRPWRGLFWTDRSEPRRRERLWSRPRQLSQEGLAGRRCSDAAVAGLRRLTAPFGNGRERARRGREAGVVSGRVRQVHAALGAEIPEARRDESTRLASARALCLIWQEELVRVLSALLAMGNITFKISSEF
mgnify:CR=1 FL=1